MHESSSQFAASRWIGPVLAAGAMLAAATVSWGGTIRLHGQARVDEQVRLQDVASLEGEAAEAHENVVVAELNGDQTRTISLDEIRGTLSKRDVNWGRLSLTGHMQCEVSRADRQNQPDDQKPAAAPNRPSAPSSEEDETQVDGERASSAGVANIDKAVSAGQAATLRQRIKRVVYQITDADASELRVKFRDRDADRLDQRILGEKWEVEPRTASSPLGRLPVVVRQYDNGRVAEQFNISVTVQRRAEALVATGKISRGDRIRPGDVTQREVWLTRDNQPLAEPGMVENQRADGLLREGDILYPDDVKAPELVKRGQLITVRCVSGDLVVRTVARARESGGSGDYIKVRNESSRETFTCRVTGPREAVVEVNDGDEPSVASKGAQ